MYKYDLVTLKHNSVTPQVSCSAGEFECSWINLTIFEETFHISQLDLRPDMFRTISNQVVLSKRVFNAPILRSFQAAVVTTAPRTLSTEAAAPKVKIPKVKVPKEPKEPKEPKKPKMPKQKVVKEAVIIKVAEGVHKIFSNFARFLLLPRCFLHVLGDCVSA